MMNSIISIGIGRLPVRKSNLCIAVLSSENSLDEIEVLSIGGLVDINVDYIKNYVRDVSLLHPDSLIIFSDLKDITSQSYLTNKKVQEIINSIYPFQKRLLRIEFNAVRASLNGIYNFFENNPD